MEIVKPGKPLVVPTEEATCPQCGAVLRYNWGDVILARRTDERIWDDHPERERMIRQSRGFSDEFDRKAIIRCPACEKAIETGKMPGKPYY